MKLEEYLQGKFSPELIDSIMTEKRELFEKMKVEQRALLTDNQYKVAVKAILPQVSTYVVMRKYMDEDKLLEYLKGYYHLEYMKYTKVMNFLGFTNIGCNLFQGLFEKSLKKDTWISEIKRNDKVGFEVDITRCLYKDICDYYECSNCCKLFCDGDWVVFGHMKKLEFQRAGTLGYGDDKCDFHYMRRE